MHPLITASIVSHQQAHLVAQLLGDLSRATIPIEVIVTINSPEQIPSDIRNDLSRCAHLIENVAPKGFAANHNSALSHSTAEYVCVLNPDIRLPEDPFPALLAFLQDPMLGAVGPRVLNTDGRTEDSAREFPTPMTILAKAFRASRSNSVSPTGGIYPDWIAGMFMLFPRRTFERVGGFDEDYFLYYEDVDICARLRKQGYRIGYCANAIAVHDARRTSHRDLKYLRWHLASMARFFWRRAVGRI